MNNKCLVVALAALILFATFANAGTITGRSAFVNEQCETDKEFYSICADEYDGTYNVDITGNAAGWIAYAPKTFSLNAGECQEVVAFITPDCYANSGAYDFTIKVSGAETFEKDATLRVTQIHNQILDVLPLTNTSKACETNEYFTTVTNASEYRGEFILTTNGIPTSWVSVENSSFVLDPYESRDMTLKVTPNCSTEPTMVEFELMASNTLTNSATSVFLVQNVVDFTPFVVEGLPTDLQACSETLETIEFMVTNTSGYGDEYNISFSGPSFATINKSTLTLDVNESETITLTMNEADVNNHFYGLSIYSQKYKRTFNVEGTMNVRDCYNISLQRVSTETSKCSDSLKEEYKITNNGIYDANIAFESGYMTGDFTTEVKVGQSKNVVLYMEAEKLGINTINLTATTNFAISGIDYNVDLLDCISYDISMVDTIETDCNKGELFPMEITNTSVVDQTIDLNSSGANFLDFSEESITLTPGEVGIMYIYVPPTSGKETGVYNATVVFDNDKGLIKERPVTVNLTEGCVPQKDFVPGAPMIKEANFDLNFYNDSNLSTEITNITIEGYDFTSNFQPMTLEPFEERIIHFELNVPQGYASRTLEAKIIVSTSLGKKSYTQEVLVTERPAGPTGLFGLVEGVGLVSLLLLIILIGLAIYALAPIGKDKGKTIASTKSKPKSKPTAKKVVNKTTTKAKAKPSAQKSASAKKGTKKASKPKGKSVKKAKKGKK